jgi:hypothetical protein
MLVRVLAPSFRNPFPDPVPNRLAVAAGHRSPVEPRSASVPGALLSLHGQFVICRASMIFSLSSTKKTLPTRSPNVYDRRDRFPPSNATRYGAQRTGPATRRPRRGRRGTVGAGQRGAGQVRCAANAAPGERGAKRVQREVGPQRRRGRCGTKRVRRAANAVRGGRGAGLGDAEWMRAAPCATRACSHPRPVGRCHGVGGLWAAGVGTAKGRASTAP